MDFLICMLSDISIFLITEGGDVVFGLSDKEFDAAQDTGTAIMRITNLNDATSFSGVNCC